MMMSEQQDNPEQIQQDAEQAPAEAAALSVEQNMQAELDAARAKAAENWDHLLRVQAEMENTRRRAAQDVEKAHKFGLEKFAQELLPVKDSLELGLAASTSADEAVAKLREGMELTLKMLGSCMEKFGIKEVNPIGEAFNPEWHQAMTMQESAEHAPNTVMYVMQKGYLLNDRLMRPAMVVVSKGIPAAPADTPSIDEQA
jgi:molecular chaperone GrpE